MVRAALLPALAALAALPAAAAGPHLSRVADAYAATSVNTAVFRQNSVTSLDSIQYVAFYDPDWHIRDLTDFSVGAWEPTLDRNLCHTRHLLHLYIQPTSQGDGETVTTAPPSPAYILELP